jgi:hypothetical protein
LDVICAPLGLHQRRIAASAEASTASGVMSDGLGHTTLAALLAELGGNER